jgi:hypothetical protein
LLINQHTFALPVYEISITCVDAPTIRKVGRVPVAFDGIMN